MRVYRAAIGGQRFDCWVPDTPEGHALAGQWLALVASFFAASMGPGHGPLSFTVSG